jgi:hypothetical protein
VEVTSIIASVGSSIFGSGTVSTRTSRLPCQVTAFIVVSLGGCCGMTGHLQSGSGFTRGRSHFVDRVTPLGFRSPRRPIYSLVGDAGVASTGVSYVTGSSGSLEDEGGGCGSDAVMASPLNIHGIRRAATRSLPAHMPPKPPCEHSRMGLTLVGTLAGRTAGAADRLSRVSGFRRPAGRIALRRLRLA